MERDNRNDRDVQVIWLKAKKLLNQINRIKHSTLFAEELYLFCKYIDNELNMPLNVNDFIKEKKIRCKPSDLDNIG